MWYRRPWESVHFLSQKLHPSFRSKNHWLKPLPIFSYNNIRSLMNSESGILAMKPASHLHPTKHWSKELKMFMLDNWCVSLQDFNPNLYLFRTNCRVLIWLMNFHLSPPLKPPHARPGWQIWSYWVERTMIFFLCKDIYRTGSKAFFCALLIASVVYRVSRFVTTKIRLWYEYNPKSIFSSVPECFFMTVFWSKLHTCKKPFDILLNYGKKTDIKSSENAACLRGAGVARRCDTFHRHSQVTSKFIFT